MPLPLPGTGLKALLASGVQVGCCNVALTVYSAMVALGIALGPMVLQVVGVYGPMPFLTGAALSLLVATGQLLPDRLAEFGIKPKTIWPLERHAKGAGKDGLERGMGHRLRLPPRASAQIPSGALAQVGPGTPAGQAAVRADVEGHQVVPVGVRDDQRGVVSGHGHPVGKRDVAGHLAHRAVRRGQEDKTRLKLLPGHRIEAGPVDVVVTVSVDHDVVPARLTEVGVSSQRPVRLPAQQPPVRPGTRRSPACRPGERRCTAAATSPARPPR